MVRFCGEKHEHLGFITKRHLLNRCVKVRIAKQNLKPTRNYINLRHPQCVSANKLFILLKWLLSYLVQVPFINYVQNCYMFRLNTGFNSIHLLKKQVNQQCQCQKMAYGRTSIDKLDCVLNVMAHAHKPDFVFRRNGRVHLNRRGLQFSRLLAAEMCVSAVVMLDIPCSKVVWRVLATHSIRLFPLHFPSHASPCAITFQLDSTSVCVPTLLFQFCELITKVYIE